MPSCLLLLLSLRQRLAVKSQGGLELSSLLPVWTAGLTNTHHHTWLSEALGGNGNPRGLGGAQGVWVRVWERKACSAPSTLFKEQVHSGLCVTSAQLLCEGRLCQGCFMVLFSYLECPSAQSVT